MSELDEYNDFVSAMNDYSRIQLRQSIDFVNGVKELLENKGDPEAIADFLSKSFDEPQKPKL